MAILVPGTSATGGGDVNMPSLLFAASSTLSTDGEEESLGP